MSELGFFEQLGIFTDRFVREVIPRLASPKSPWGLRNWGERGPSGAVIHYTADDSFERVVRWFCDPKYNSRVSAHVVVLDRKHPEHNKHCAGLSLIRKLPATVIQCRHPQQPAAHATWTNKALYGVELLNPGRLQPVIRKVRQGTMRGVDWLALAKRTGTWKLEPFEPRGRSVTVIQGHAWVSYPSVQVAAAVTVLRSLKSLDTFIDRGPQWILGHEHVQPEKSDPGPLFPIHAVRAAVTDGSMRELRHHKVDPEYFNFAEDQILLDAMRAMGVVAGDVKPLVAAYKFIEILARWVGGEAPFDPIGSAMLELLGYHTGRVWDAPKPNYNKALVESLGVFKNGVLDGGSTDIALRRSLVARLHERPRSCFSPDQQSAIMGLQYPAPA